jgi:hypothetical protein
VDDHIGGGPGPSGGGGTNSILFLYNDADSVLVLPGKCLSDDGEVEYTIEIISYDENRYPDNVFFDMLFDMADQAGILSQLRVVLKKSLKVRREVIMGKVETEAIYV